MENNELFNKFENEIDKHEFNFFEISGFKTKPRLALLAGMAIGYQMACNDHSNTIERLASWASESSPEISKDQ